MILCIFVIVIFFIFAFKAFSNHETKLDKMFHDKIETHFRPEYKNKFYDKLNCSSSSNFVGYSLSIEPTSVKLTFVYSCFINFAAFKYSNIPLCLINLEMQRNFNSFALVSGKLLYLKNFVSTPDPGMSLHFDFGTIFFDKK